MALKATTKLYPTREKGMYSCIVSAIKQGQRQPFGSSNSKELEPCFNFYFLPETDVALPAEEQNAFLLSTGTNFGSRKAGLTKTVNSIVGRTVEAEEIDRLDLLKLQGLPVNLMIDLEDTDDGGKRNTILAIQRQGEPLELAPLLDPAPPKGK